MYKKDIDPNEQLDTAISSLQIAIESMKQARAQETKVWQKNTIDLQNQVQTLQSQLTESVNLNSQLQNELQEVTLECNRLRAVNQSLVKKLQEKEMDISRFNALNESLRSLLDGSNHPPKPSFTTQGEQNCFHSYQPTSFERPIPQPIYETNPDFHNLNSMYQKNSLYPNSPDNLQDYNREQFQKQSPQKVHAQMNLASKEKPVKEAKKSTKGKSSLFLQLAKEELTYSAFNSLINEINKYNKQKQNKQTTISNVQSILCPNHQTLFDQFLPMISGI